MYKVKPIEHYKIDSRDSEISASKYTKRFFVHISNVWQSTEKKLRSEKKNNYIANENKYYILENYSSVLLSLVCIQFMVAIVIVFKIEGMHTFSAFRR